SLLREQERVAAPDAAARAGDDRDLAVEEPHEIPPKAGAKRKTVRVRTISGAEAIRDAPRHQASRRRAPTTDTRAAGVGRASHLKCESLRVGLGKGAARWRLWGMSHPEDDGLGWLEGSDDTIVPKKSSGG